MYVYVFVYIVHMDVYAAGIQVCLYAHAQIIQKMHASVRVYECTCVCARECASVHVWVRKCARVGVCECASVRVCTCGH